MPSSAPWTGRWSSCRRCWRAGGGAGPRRPQLTPHADMPCPPPVLLQYPPPLIPPRGEVNAADAFDIGSFDEEDTKGIKVLPFPHGLWLSAPPPRLPRDHRCVRAGPRQACG